MNPARQDSNNHDVGRPSGGNSHQASTDTPLQNAALIALADAVKAGDRETAARLLLDEFGSRIRRRIRGSLTNSERRLFDSDDVLARIVERFDRLLQRNPDQDPDPAQIASYVDRIVLSVVKDAARQARTLERSEAGYRSVRRAYEVQTPRSPKYQRLLEFLEEIDRTGSISLSDVNRTIVRMRLSGANATEIGRAISMSGPAVRQRWRRLVKQFEAHLDDVGQSTSNSGST